MWADEGRLVSAGRAGSELPRRFYQFGLIDPVDQPFATFRFYYRSWEQLRELGLLEDGYCTDGEDEMSVIEPGEGSANGESSGDGTEAGKVDHNEVEDVFQAGGDGISVHDGSAEGYRQQTEDLSKRASTPAQSTANSDRSSLCRDSIASGTYIPRGAPASRISTGSPSCLRRRGPMNTYRLSIPPSIKLDAPEPASRAPPLPQKNDFSSSTAYRPHPAYPEEWTARTPSPVRSVRDRTTTPPLQRRKGLGIVGAGLMGVISSWKRSVGSARGRRKSGVEGARSVSY